MSLWGLELVGQHREANPMCSCPFLAAGKSDFIVESRMRPLEARGGRDEEREVRHRLHSNLLNSLKELAEKCFRSPRKR